MKHCKVWMSLFLLGLFFGVGTADANPVAAQDPDVERLRGWIEVLERNLESSHTLRAKIASTRDTAKEQLQSLSTSISNVEMSIASAQAFLAMAQNDAERAEWAAVILTLKKSRLKLKSQYNTVAHKIHGYEERLATLDEIHERYGALLTHLKSLFTPPDSPASFSVSNGVARGSVELTWTESHVPELGLPILDYEYQYQRQLSARRWGAWSSWTSAGTDMFELIGGLHSRGRYAFRMRAVNGLGPGTTTGQIIIRTR